MMYHRTHLHKSSVAVICMLCVFTV